MIIAILITLVLAVAAYFIAAHFVDRHLEKQRQKEEQKLKELSAPHIESISIMKKVLLDEGEVQTIPVSIFPKECVNELEVEYTEPDVCKVDIVEEGLMLSALKQGKVIVTVYSGEVSERCLICVRKRLTLNINLDIDPKSDCVKHMTAYMKSDEEIKFRCQVLFSVTADGKSRYFFANKVGNESLFISNSKEVIPHVAEELENIRRNEPKLQQLRLWVTNLKYDQDRYHIIIKNKYKSYPYWWKKYDR